MGALQISPKKYTTQPPRIIVTVVFQFQFWYKYYWLNMPLKGGLISHSTRLMYVAYLGKL